MDYLLNSMKAIWNYPTLIYFGLGQISRLPETCKMLGIKRPLLVTDPNIAKLSMITKTLDQNSSEGLPTGIFSDIQPNPISQNIIDGTNAYKDGNFDGIIGWGGGSSIDAAKAIAFMVSQNRPIWDFEDIGKNWEKANRKNIAPIIAVPTTSGTGSEVGRASVITNEKLKIKKIIFHPKMLPSAVICDPSLVKGLPKNLTAFTGMDALIHCFEAYCSPNYHPMANGIALEGLKLSAEWLPRAYLDGSDLEARSHMMSVALMGATAFQKGLGAIHALSHSVGALYETHHGLTNAVFMPYVIKFNRTAVEEKLDHITKYLNLPKTGYRGLLDWVLDLRDKFKIPTSALDLGVKHKDLEKLSIIAASDPTATTNPVSIGVTETRELFLNALQEFS